MNRLPSLNALRAFEVAGRHLSFTRAARELNVTQAAVSHQIKALEAQLGVRLFRRAARGLLLTDTGQAYLSDVREAFRRLIQATERLRTRDVAGVLTVSVLPSLASRWLIHRLGGFQERHPEIDVRVSADDRTVQFDREDVDVAIRYGRGVYPGAEADLFLTEELFPVCSPRLMEGPHPLRQPADLAHHMLLHDDLPTNWAMWLKVAGATNVDPTRGPAFTDSGMVLQAAIDGMGVALGRSALAGDDLAAGRLVRPFDIILPADNAYYLVYPEHTANRPKIKAFRDWILAEAGALETA